MSAGSASKSKPGTQAGSSSTTATADKSESQPHRKKTVGRPTKLTPELVERVCRYIRAGSFIESAALGCGITRQTFYTWMRAGNAARDDRLEHSQRGLGEFVLTPNEERCVEFLDAMEEALSVAENRWVCGIVEAGERDWRAWAWRADRRTRLPHGYRACGEWDLGATESTLSGIRERQAARVEWQRKMRTAAAAAAAAEDGRLKMEDGGKAETAAEAATAAEDVETRGGGDAEMVTDELNVEHRTSNAEHRIAGSPEVIAKDAEMGRRGDAEKEKSARGKTGSAHSTGSPQALRPSSGQAGHASKVVKKSGSFMVSVVLLLGLWLMGAQRGWAGDESGFQPLEFARRGSWALGPLRRQAYGGQTGWDEAAPLALSEEAKEPGLPPFHSSIRRHRSSKLRCNFPGGMVF